MCREQMNLSAVTAIAIWLDGLIINLDNLIVWMTNCHIDSDLYEVQ